MIKKKNYYNINFDKLLQKIIVDGSEKKRNIVIVQIFVFFIFFVSLVRRLDRYSLLFRIKMINVVYISVQQR